jgi:hypothetical protein
LPQDTSPVLPDDQMLGVIPEAAGKSIRGQSAKNQCGTKGEKSQGHFRSKVEVKSLPPVDVQWVGVGQTAGLVFWVRSGGIGAVSVCLNGMEIEGEADAARTMITSNRLPLPPNVWQDLCGERRPLLANLFFDVASLTDPVIASAAIAASGTAPANVVVPT